MSFISFILINKFTKRMACLIIKIYFKYLQIATIYLYININWSSLDTKKVYIVFLYDTNESIMHFCQWMYFSINKVSSILQYVCKRTLQYHGILQDMITRNRSITLPRLIVILSWPLLFFFLFVCLFLLVYCYYYLLLATHYTRKAIHMYKQLQSVLIPKKMFPNTIKLIGIPICWLWAYLTNVISRNASCALNYISTF